MFEMGINQTRDTIRSCKEAIDIYKQIIIVRKDLQMSPGKMAAQVSHASMAFLSHMIREHTKEEDGVYTCQMPIDKELFDQWLNGEFTKVVLRAKNKSQLLKAVDMAKKIGMKEGKDFFLIKDNCHTELTPEEDGRTLTCIGFRPMEATVIDQIGKKYQLFS